MELVTLHGNVICPFSQRVMLGLEYLAIAHEFVEIEFVAKPFWLEQVSPFRKIPVLHVNGIHIFESAAILSYLNRQHQHQLSPRNNELRAVMEAWCATLDPLHALLRDLFTNKDRIDFNNQAKTVKNQLSVLQRAPLYGTSDAVSLLDLQVIPLLLLADVIQGLVAIELLAEPLRKQFALYRRTLPLHVIDTPRYRNQIKQFLFSIDSALYHQHQSVLADGST